MPRSSPTSLPEQCSRRWLIWPENYENTFAPTLNPPNHSAGLTQARNAAFVFMNSPGQLTRADCATKSGHSDGLLASVLHHYSNRNAEIGSTRVAFRAGTQTATSATAHRKIGVRMNAVGSHVFTPKRNPVRNLVSQKAPPIPMTSPIPARSIPWRITMFRIFADCAPSAILTPSSWVRCWTE